MLLLIYTFINYSIVGMWLVIYIHAVAVFYSEHSQRYTDTNDQC